MLPDQPLYTEVHKLLGGQALWTFLTECYCSHTHIHSNYFISSFLSWTDRMWENTPLLLLFFASHFYFSTSSGPLSIQPYSNSNGEKYVVIESLRNFSMQITHKVTIYPNPNPSYLLCSFFNIKMSCWNILLIHLFDDSMHMESFG